MNVDDITPVFVIGAGHSGTTILYRMLAFHPDATWISQYSARAVLVHGIAGRSFAAADRVLRSVFAHAWTKTGMRGSRRIAPIPIEARTVWTYALGDLSQREEVIRRVRRVALWQCRQTGKRIFLAKPPGKYRTRCGPLTSAAFPSARYVHVLRDGRAVAMSVLEKLRTRHGPSNAFLPRAAQHWTRALGNIRAFEEQLPMHIVRYEAFCADVHGELRRALEFSGLDPERFPYDHCPPRLTSTNEARTRRATADELQTLEHLLADELVRTGYAVRQA